MTRWEQQKGFTLVEVLITIPIVTAVILAGLVYMLNSIKASDVLLERNTDELRVRNIIQIVSKHLRSMRNGQQNEYALSLAEDNEVLFYANADVDSDIERIRYRRNGTNLEQGITNPAGGAYAVADDVVTVLYDGLIDDGQPLFRYYSGSYTGSEAPLASPVNESNVRFITMRTMTSIGETGGIRVLEKSTTLRNLLFSLE